MRTAGGGPEGGAGEGREEPGCGWGPGAPQRLLQGKHIPARPSSPVRGVRRARMTRSSPAPPPSHGGPPLRSCPAGTPVEDAGVGSVGPGPVCRRRRRGKTHIPTTRRSRKPREGRIFSFNKRGRGRKGAETKITRPLIFH